jgi:acyl-CoA dehydrogenase
MPVIDFSHDPTTEALAEQLRDFLAGHVHPAEDAYLDELGSSTDPWAWDATAVMQDLRAEARRRGLWNLFLPGVEGAGLTHTQYAPLAELSGRSLLLAPAAMNCAAPDAGNMELLSMFGSADQKARWLDPLLSGEIRSSFAMTEPDVASSDATNIATRIRREGDGYVVTGRKWWITGAMNPNARVFIVMGKTDPGAERHRQQSMLLVPRDAPGVTVRRALTVLGYADHDHGGHAEVVFEDAVVPRENLLGGEGDGFAMAQARLGPGRLHHCLRCIGVAERAIELMCARADGRAAFGVPLAKQGIVRGWIADARVWVEQLRLLALKAAWRMDTHGTRAAHADIQALKIAAPATTQWILDRAIQLHGAGGLSQDFPLAGAYAAVRSMRLADGPDEVHRDALARAELRRQSASRPR